LAALGERHIDPTQQICQRSFIKKYKVSFHRQNQATLPNLNPEKQPDSVVRMIKGRSTRPHPAQSLYIITLSAAAS
ncbi:hypothetical protein, partial [Brucella pseudogrignonensis]|uniref:hypothetical protein n=1 Tax=Brucella pseudogrignonensis TaxID=419475 RepID=UPI001AECF8C1